MSDAAAKVPGPKAPRERKSPTAALPPIATNLPVLKGKVVLAIVEDFVAVAAEVKLLEARQKVLRDQLVAAMAGAPVAFAGCRTLNLATVAPTPETPSRVITREMLGQILPGKPGRAGYVQLRVQ